MFLRGVKRPESQRQEVQRKRKGKKRKIMLCCASIPQDQFGQPASLAQQEKLSATSSRKFGWPTFSYYVNNLLGWLIHNKQKTNNYTKKGNQKTSRGQSHLRKWNRLSQGHWVWHKIGQIQCLWEPSMEVLFWDIMFFSSGLTYTPMCAWRPLPCSQFWP